MSNALRRKKKPDFYTKVESKEIHEKALRDIAVDNTVSRSYKEFMVIGYIILHDKFGFGQKRIIRLQDTVNKYLDEVANGNQNMSGNSLAYFLDAKYKVNVTEKVNSVPQRQLMKLYTQKGRVKEGDAYRISSASMFNYLALTLTALKSMFKMTAKQLNEFCDKFIDYIDTLANYDRYALTVPMIADTLADEINFKCDLEGVT